MPFYQQSRCPPAYLSPLLQLTELSMPLLLCAQILGVSEPSIAEKLDAKRAADAAKVLAKDRELAQNL